MLSGFPKSKIKIIKPDGQVIENLQAVVQPKLVVLDNAKIIVDEKDTIQRTLSNGKTEEYIVEEATFYEPTFGFPAHYQLKVRKSNLPPKVNGQTTIIAGTGAKINIASTDYSTTNK